MRKFFTGAWPSG